MWMPQRNGRFRVNKGLTLSLMYGTLLQWQEDRATQENWRNRHECVFLPHEAAPSESAMHLAEEPSWVRLMSSPHVPGKLCWQHLDENGGGSS